MANLKRNIAYNFAYQLLILALPLITSPYLSRVIGAEGLGTYSYSFAIATYFVYFVKLGLDNYGNRTIAGCGNDRAARSRAFWSIYAMQCACFVASGCVYLTYVFLFASNTTVAMFQGLYVLSSLLDINWLFFGVEQFGITVARNTVVKATTTVMVFLFVRDARDVNSYVAIMAGGFLASQVVLWPFLRRFIDWYRPSVRDVLPHVKPNMVLFVSVIAVSVYNTLSRVFLGFMQGVEAVGYFESAVRLVSVPTALVNAVGTVMLPRTSALLAAGDNTTARAHTDATMMGVMAFAGVASFGMATVASPFVLWFYGPGFEEAAKVLVILCATIPLLGFGNVMRTQFLIPRGLDGVFLRSALCGAMSSVVVNLLTVGALGAVGSALASVAAEVSVLAYQCFRVCDSFPLRRYARYAACYLTCGALMRVALGLVPVPEDPFLATSTLVAAGLVIYVSLALLSTALMRRFKA